MYFGDAYFMRVALPVVENNIPDVINVGFPGAGTQMLRPNPAPYLIEKFCFQNGKVIQVY